jgi:hypothetical protein
MMIHSLCRSQNRSQVTSQVMVTQAEQMFPRIVWLPLFAMSRLDELWCGNAFVLLDVQQGGSKLAF